MLKEGSIIPIGPEIQFTDEKPGDPLTFFVYPGRNCSFTLYEDEGTNYNYEKGECSTIKFSFDNSTGDLTIGDRNGEYNGMAVKRIFNIVWIDKDHPVAFDPEIKPHASVTYEGNKMIVAKPE